MRRLTNSGGALTLDLVRDLRGMFPQSKLFPMYGLTEAFRSTYLDPELVDEHPTSMGRAAIPFAEILVITDDGRWPDRAGGRTGALRSAGGAGVLAGCRAYSEAFKPAPAMSEYGARRYGRATGSCAMRVACYISSGGAMR